MRTTETNDKKKNKIIEPHYEIGDRKTEKKWKEGNSISHKGAGRTRWLQLQKAC